MPVSASTVQFSYVGDGITTTFPFPSRFLTTADLIVGVDGAQVLSGFSVTGAGNDAGGNVVFSVAPVNGAAVTLIRAPAISQLLDFVNNQTVLAENIDNGLDKLTIVAQYLSYLLDRTLKLSQFDTGLTGNYDLMLKRLTNLGAPVDGGDAVRLTDVQNLVSTAGNVPSPTGGQIGFVLKAISAGVFGWIAAGNPLAPDGTLAAPGYGFANETNTGFLRPSAGVLQAAILGVLKTELTAAQFRLLVPLVQSMATAVTAGTNVQGQGALTNSLNVVTTTAASPSGVTLPTPVAGQSIRVINRGTNPINLYPAAGGTIGALAANAPISLPVGATVDLFARTTTQWEGYASQPLDPDLTALAAFNSTGLAVRTSADTWAQRQIVSSDGSLTITNPAGVLGDINLSVGGPWTTGAIDNANTGATVTYSGAIPSTAKEIIIRLAGLSLSGSGDARVRLLEAGTPKATGYLGWGHFDFSIARDATGFRLRIGDATRVISGDLILRLDSSSGRWRCDGFLVETSTGISILETHGWVDSVANLSGFNLTTTAGTFDGAGTVQAFWR